MKNKGLASSIVISIFITIFALIILFLATNSFTEMFAEVAEEAQESNSENPEAGIAFAFASVFVGFAILLVFIIPMAFMFVASIILLPVSIKNRHSNQKWIRILSYVFDGILAFCIAFDIFKFLLIRLGNG